MVELAKPDGGASRCGQQPVGVQLGMPPRGRVDADRVGLLEHHPVVRRQYTVPTQMIQYAYQVSRERVYARRTGLVFVGKTRYGKTTCALAVQQYLLDEFPRIHVIVVPARSSLRPTDGHAFRVILESERHVCAARTDPDTLLRNVVSDVETALYAKGGDHFVLVLDEVNLFKQQDIVNLLELSNMLNMRHITMTVISFGQPDVEQLITSLQQQNKHQLLARFFRRPKSFEGCTSQEMLESVLNYLDEKSKWPEDSGWSYTEFFFPVAFSHGFRLKNYSEIIWNEMSSALPTLGNGLSMEAVAMTVEWLYLSLYQNDSESFVLQMDDIQSAIQASDSGWDG
ncbi:ATP-binding protein [Burkholderia cenocepacia]|uniref:ATP-binding protein n=1 Tax=Burkholderia cenocepacia TaxID=95486 RepID=UPI001F4B0EC6|nr:ATP-binding protein [Burkholderia cenocepacia]